MNIEYPTEWMHRWAQHLGLDYGVGYPANIEALALLDLIKEAASAAPAEKVAMLAEMVNEKQVHFAPRVLKPKIKEVFELIEAARFELKGIKIGAVVEIFGKRAEVLKISLRGGNCLLRVIATDEVLQPSPTSLRRNATVASPRE